MTLANFPYRETQDKTPSGSNKASDHKNEGFLKSAWHRLTHQHDNLEPDASSKENTKPETKTKTDKEDEEPKKKASGSG